MSEPVSLETSNVNVEAAIAAAGRATGGARRALMRRLLDVVALPSSRGGVQDRAIAADLLLDLLLESDISTREMCARRLRDMAQAPKRLLRHLALDAPSVARILLADNRGFDEADLMQIVAAGASAHRIAIAQRRDVGPAVATAIGASGDVLAMQHMLENPLARLSDQAIEAIADASREAPALIPLLLDRGELRPATALSLFWWAGPSERRHILTRFSADRSLLLESCSDIFKMAREEGWSDLVVQNALHAIERRQRDRSATRTGRFSDLEAAITEARAKGMTTALCDEISRISTIKPATGQRIFRDPGGEGVGILCKATGLKRPFLKDIWAALGRNETDGAFARVSGIYETVAVAKAQTVLRYWNWTIASSSPVGIAVA